VKLHPHFGQTGVFGKIDAGCAYDDGHLLHDDVKQFIPEEWSSPPLEGRLVQKAGLGTVCMGRGAVNQKGPENSFLSALMAFKAAGRNCRLTSCSCARARRKLPRRIFTR